MAITAATVTGDFDSGFLPREIAQPIFERAARISVAQSLIRQVPLGASGVAIPVVTGRMSAGWVAETGVKPASRGQFGIKTITPKKLAAVAVVSAEVVRANPGGYMDIVRPQIAEAFAMAFDAAVFHGTSTPFDTYLDQTSKAVEVGAATAANGGVWADLVAALDLLVTDDKRLTGWALDSVMEPSLLGSVDTAGRPIFVDIPLADTTEADNRARSGRLMSRPSFMADGIATTNKTTVVGYGGDFSQCAWGSVGGITYDVSTEATVTINGALTSLWERNLVAIRAEAEYGFLCNDVAAFVRLMNASGS